MRVYLTSLTGNNTMVIQQNVGLLGGTLPIVNTTGATTNVGPFTGQSVVNPTPTYEGGVRLGGGLLDIPGINHGGTPLLSYGNRDYQYGSAPLYNSPADYSIWGTPVGAPGASMPPGTAPDFGGFVPGKVTPNVPDVVGAAPVVPGDGGGDNSYAPIESSPDTDWTNPDDWVTGNIAPGDALLLNMLVPGMGTVAQVLQGLVARTNPFTGEISYTRLPWYDGSAGGGYGYTKDDISGGWDESFDDYNTGDLWAKDSSLKQIAADILGWGTATSELTPEESAAMDEGWIKGPWEGTDVYNASLEGYREEERLNIEAAELEAELEADNAAEAQAALEQQTLIDNIVGSAATYDAEGNLVSEATGINALIADSADATELTISELMDAMSDTISGNQTLTDKQMSTISDAMDEISLSIGDNEKLTIQQQSDLLAEFEELSNDLFGADAIYDTEGVLISDATAGVLSSMQESIESNQLTTADLDALGITITDDQITAADLTTLTENISEGMVTVTDLEDVGLDIKDFLVGTPIETDAEGNIITEATVGALDELGMSVLDNSITADDILELQLNILDGIITVDDLAAVGLDIKDFLVGTDAVLDAEGNVVTEATEGALDHLNTSIKDGQITTADLDALGLTIEDGMISQTDLDALELNIQAGMISQDDLDALGLTIIDGRLTVADLEALGTGITDSMLTQEQLDALGITVTDAMLTEAQLETLTNNIIGAEAVFDEEGNLITEGTGLTGIINTEFDSSAEGLEGWMTELETLSSTNQDLTDTQLTNITDAIDEMSLAIGDNADLDIQEQADMLAQLESLSNTFAHPLADYFDAEGYNVLGEDSEGYDREGYNNGYDREGYNAQGYDYSGYDSAGYDSFGLDSDGFDADGYDELGFDLGGYDSFGYDINGYDTSGFDASGYNVSGYDSTGYDSFGYDKYGYDNTGFDADGYDELGFDLGGYDSFGYDINGYDTSGYDASGLNPIGNTESQQTSADSVSSGSSSVNGSDFASVDEATAVANHGFGSDEHFAAIDAAADAGGDSGGGSDDNSGGYGDSDSATDMDADSGWSGADSDFDDSSGGDSGGGDDSGCFIADTLVTDSTGKDKAISEYKIGDSVMSIDGKTANKVKYIEVMSWDDEYELYSPTTKLKPFITKNHPIKVEGKWVSADLDYTERNHPWIDAVDIDTPVIKKGKGIVVYNLWVDGDNTYTVNGYDTETLIGDGGVVRQGLEYGNINMEDFKNIIKSSLSSTPEVTYGMHILNMALAFITNKKANGFILDVVLGKRKFIPLDLLIYSVGKTAILLKNKDTQMKLTNKLIPQRR